MKTSIEIPATASTGQINNNHPLIGQLTSPTGLSLMALLGGLAVLSLMGEKQKKGKLSTSYWGGTSEKK